MLPSPTDSNDLKLSSPSCGNAKSLRLAIYILVLIAAIILHIAAPSILPVSVIEGNLLGADAYMQIVRLREFIDFGDWYTVSRSNAPYGEAIYWTHPFQVILLVLSGLLWPFMDYPSNLHWAGILVSPILHLTLVFVSAWTAKPVLGPYRFWVMPVILVQVPVLSQALAGRADHHILLFLIFMIAVGLVLRMVKAPKHRNLAFLCGAVHGVALWFSVEHILLIATTLAFGGLWWALSRQSTEYRRRIIRQNLRFCIAFSVSIAIVLIIERPFATIAAPDVDLISVVYLLLAILTAIFWFAIDRLTRSDGIQFGGLGRLMIGSFGGGFLLMLLYLTYPGFFSGPLVHATPIVQSVLLELVADMQPIQALPLRSIIVIYGSAMISIPTLCWFVFRSRYDRSFIAWIYLSLGMSLYIFVATRHVRFMPYAICLGAIPLAYGFDSVRRYSETNLKRLPGIAVRAAAALLVFLGPGFVVPFLNFPSNAEKKLYIDTLAICQTQQIAPSLNSLSGNKIILLPYIYAGPETMYHTRHSVIGTPYQRNHQGIEDTFHIMTATNDRVAKRIIEKRGIDLILICNERILENLLAAPGQPQTLYGQLRNGEAPGWIERIDLPDPIKSKFMLFGVRKSAT